MLILVTCCAFPSLHAMQLVFDRPQVELEAEPRGHDAYSEVPATAGKIGAGR